MRDSLQDVLGRHYEIKSQLTCSHSKTLFLLGHIPTNSIRIAKCIDTYTHSPCECLNEARILRLLNSSMIPRLHDEIVTDHYYFLVEDYVSGVSLDALVLHQKISLKLFNLICTGLFHIFTYLHSRSTPVYYLDLKPEHIFLRNKEICLVDFDASSLGGVMPRCRRATLRFAPPELLKKGDFVCDAATDVFGLGRIMRFLTQHASWDISDELMKLISKACRYDPAMRYQSVSEMEQDFLRLIPSETEYLPMYRYFPIKSRQKVCGSLMPE